MDFFNIVFFLVFTIGYVFYDFLIPLHPQIRCACVHIVALIKRHIHSCASVSSHARTDTEAAPHSPRTGKVVSFIQTLFSRLKSKPRGEEKKSHSSNTVKPFLILHGFLSRIFPKRAPRVCSL